GSTGAANDLAEATSIATRMVREFGLSKTIGPVGYATEGPRYLGETAADLARRPYSEHTQKVVDEEVARLLREAEERAVGLLRAHRTALDRLAKILQEHETIDGAVVLETLEAEQPTAGSGPKPAPAPLGQWAAGAPLLLGAWPQCHVAEGLHLASRTRLTIAHHGRSPSIRR
ncbi:MAG TPA: hypothetical protein VFZ37_19600, partial [Jiangellaceae bacterium]